MSQSDTNNADKMNRKKNYLKSLSVAERKVLDVLINNKVQSDDVKLISQLSNLTEFQTAASLSLLKVKNLFPE